jgi:hypothetical protein
MIFTLIVEPAFRSGTLDNGMDSGVRDWEYLWLGPTVRIHLILPHWLNVQFEQVVV